MSVLNYSSEIWGFYKSKHCDKIHLRAVRYFLGVHKFCPTPAILGDIGGYPHNIICQINMIHFWKRLNKLEDNRLTKSVFLWDYSIRYQNIEQIFENTNLGKIFND